MITGAVLLATALVVGSFGAAIRSGYTQLVAGYDPDRVTDEDGLAAFVGRYLLVIAVLIFGVGTLELAGVLPDTAWPWLVLTAVILAITLRLAVGMRQFE
jgi:hypothetical protein